jgi:hypothetical protein
MTAFYPIFSAYESPDLASALGDMVLAWAGAEEKQVFLFSQILNITANRAERLYQEYSNFRSRTHALETLIELHPNFASTKPLVSKLSALSMTRNLYVHGMFLQSRDSSEIRLCNLGASESSHKRIRPTKPHDIIQHANAVRVAAWDLTSATQQIAGYEEWEAMAFCD